MASLTLLCQANTRREKNFAQHCFSSLRAARYPIIFVWILLESLGAPIAGEAVLLLAGSLVATQRLTLLSIILTAWAGALIGDTLVFRLGRQVGDRSLQRLLGLYCQYTLCSSECFLKTKDCFLKFGWWTIIFARFVLGVRAMTPPLSGMLGYSYGRFAVFDGIGILIWTLAFSLTGRYLGRHWSPFSEAVPYLTAVMLALALTSALGVTAWKLLRRRRYGPASLETKSDVASEPESRFCPVESSSGKHL